MDIVYFSYKNEGMCFNMYGSVQ